MRRGANALYVFSQHCLSRRIWRAQVGLERGTVCAAAGMSRADPPAGRDAVVGPTIPTPVWERRARAWRLPQNTPNAGLGKLLHGRRNIPYLLIYRNAMWGGCVVQLTDGERENATSSSGPKTHECAPRQLPRSLCRSRRCSSKPPGRSIKHDYVQSKQWHCESSQHGC